MAYDSTKPAVADNYSTGYTQTIRDNFDFVLKLGDANGSAMTVNGTVPTGAKRYNATSDYFEYYTGSAWALLPLDYLRKAGGGAQTCTQDTNFTGLLQKNGTTVWAGYNFNPDTKANLVGANFTGAITTTTTVTATQRLFGNGSSGNGYGTVTVTSSTSAPTGGAQGDIHIIYTP